MSRRARWLATQARKRRIAAITAILRRYEASPFEHESACIAGLRSGLCLLGWSWREADREARETVAEGLRRIGARRPPWAWGQPDYAHGTDFIERTRCARCGGPLPAERRRYCSDLCISSAWAARARLASAAERQTLTEARHAA